MSDAEIIEQLSHERSWPRLSATFFLACLAAMELEGVTFADI
jgi:hypothetical protein